MVGIVVTTSPSFSLYKMVVFPAPSNPTIRMRISFLPKNLEKSFPNARPIFLAIKVSKTKKKSNGLYKKHEIQKKSVTFTLL
jgi:hypothetical protein